MTTEQYIDIETRMRLQEKLNNLILTKLDTLDSKIDNQFKWIIGILLGFLGTVTLHVVKLI